MTKISSPYKSNQKQLEESQAQFKEGSIEKQKNIQNIINNMYQDFAIDTSIEPINIGEKLERINE